MSLSITATRADLTNALTQVAVGVDSGRGAPMVMRGVLIEASSGSIALSTRGYRVQASTALSGTVSGHGQALVRHDELVKLVGALVKGKRKREADNTEIALTVSDSGDFTVSAGGYSVPLEQLPTEDFLEPAALPGIVARVGDAGMLTREMTRVARFASRDMPHIAGVLFRVTPTRLRMATTDRFRLAETVLPLEGGTEAAGIVTTEVVTAFAKHAAGETVDVGMSGEHVLLRSGDMTIIATTIDSEFPPYRQLFPDTTMSVAFDRKTALGEIERCRAILQARDAGTQSAIEIKDGQIAFRPHLPPNGLGEAPGIAAQVQGTGDGCLVGANIDYVREALQSLDSDTAVIGTVSPTKPIVFSSPEGGQYSHLLMPVRMQGITV